MRARSIWATVFAVVAATLAMPSTAAACSLPALDPFEVDGHKKPAEVADPQAVTPRLVQVERGHAGQTSACDGMGRLDIAIKPSPPHMGYLVEVTGGHPPELFGLDAHQPVRLSSGDTLTLYWSDGATDAQEAIDFDMAVTPVNEAGEIGPKSAPIQISDPGGSPSTACSVADGPGPVEPEHAVFLVAVVLVAWRRLTDPAEA